MSPIISKIIATLILFIAGSFYPVINNTILTYQFQFEKNLSLQFQQPWFQTLLSFTGMSFFIIPSLIKTRCKEDINSHNSEMAVFRSSSFSSILGIFSLVLQTYSLIYMPVHVWQIFNEFYLLFSALFSIIIGRKKLHFTDWIGLFFVVFGISLAGVSVLIRSIHQRSELTTEIFFSFILQILGHSLKAFVELSEESLLENSSSLTVTAYEGLWGVYLITLIILPIVNITQTDLIIFHERSPDILTFLKGSSFLIIFEVFFIISFAIYRFSEIYLLGASKARRSVYESFLPITIWLLSFIKYKIQKNNILPFIDNYSYLEIAGLVITLLGSLMYHKIIKLSCFVYSKENLDTSRDVQIMPNNYVLD